MADNTTRLKILAQVEGIQGFDTLKRSLQGLAQQGQGTQRDLFRLVDAYKQLKSNGDNTIAGMRSQVAVLTQLRESVSTTGALYKRWGAELDQVQGKLRSLAQAERSAAQGASRPGMGMAGALVTGGGIRGALSMQAGEAAMAGRLALAGGITAGVAAGAGVAAIAGASVTTARDVEAQQRKVSTLTNDTRALNDAIADLVRTQGYMTSQASATSAAYEILSSGFSRTDDVIKILKASTSGAVGGFSDIKTVADATTSILNGYGRSADDARRVVDMMIQTQNDGKIVVGEYAQSIGRLVPMAAMANISLEEVNGAISALTAQGVPIESTFSGLSQMIKSIIKPTDEARAMAAKLGLDFSGAALSTKKLDGFLSDLIVKTKGNSDALGILFSDIDGYKAVVGLTNDRLKRFNESTANQSKLIAQASTAAKKAVDPFEQYSNANKDLGNAMGKILLPPLTKVTQLTTNLIKALMTNNLPGRMKGFADFIKETMVNVIPGGAALEAGSDLLNLNVEPPPPPPKDGRTDLPKPKPILPTSKAKPDKAISDLVNEVLSGGAGKPSAEDLILKKPYGAQIIAAARKKGLDPALFAGLISQESGFRASIKSRAGAIGLGQLMPGTAAELGVNPYDPTQNLAGAAEYLSRMIGQYGLTGGLRAYNQGPGNQNLYPQGKSKEARDYPSAVLAQAKQFGYDDKSGIKSAELQIEAINTAQKRAEQQAKEQKETIDRNRKLGEQSKEQEQSYFDRYQTVKGEAAALQQMTESQKLLTDFANDILRIERETAEAKASATSEDAASLAIATGEVQKQARLTQLYQAQAEIQSAESSQSWAQQQEALQGTLTGYYQQQADLLGEQNQLAVTLSQSIGQGLQQAFSLAIQGTEDWGASLKQLASGVLQDIAQQLLQIAVITPIINSIAGVGARGIAPIAPGITALPGGDFTGAFTGGGGMSFTGGLPAATMTPGAFPFATGGIMTPQGPVPLRRYAQGGIATAPQAAIYGEGAGSEAFVPLPDGRRIPVALRQYPGIPGTPGAAGSFEQTDAVVQRLVETARQESAVRAATAAAAGPDGTMRIQVETTRINSVDYVTADQAQALAEAAATRSTARQRRALQASPAVRRSVGM